MALVHHEAVWHVSSWASEDPTVVGGVIRCGHLRIPIASAPWILVCQSSVLKLDCRLDLCQLLFKFLQVVCKILLLVDRSPL
jgi:hypothetical protein